MEKYVLAIIIISIGGLGLWVYSKNQPPELIVVDLPEAKVHQEFADNTIQEDKVDLIIEDIIDNEEDGLIVETNEKPIVKPIVEEINSINLAVPFTSQAPTANWDQPFQDACEEASVLMVAYYYQNKSMPSKEAVENILLEMINWQSDFMSGDYDINVEETGQFAKGFFGYNTKVIPDLTATKIRNFLREGFPVIVPANGHILNNPNFTGDGPKYHMLVIKGFVDDKFITNDPGTRNGENFVYTEANLMAAIADWDKEKALTVGPKVALILLEN